MKQLSIYDSVFENDIEQNMRGPISSQANNGANENRTSPLKVKAASDRTKANVTEIILTKEMGDSVQMILPMLSHMSQENKWLAWIDPPVQLLKSWQKKPGVDARLAKDTMNNIMVLRSNDSISAFELAQQALKAGTCHAVVTWTNKLSKEKLNSLEAASAIGNSHGIILRYR